MAFQGGEGGGKEEMGEKKIGKSECITSEKLLHDPYVILYYLHQSMSRSRVPQDASCHQVRHEFPDTSPKVVLSLEYSVWRNESELRSGQVDEN